MVATVCGSHWYTILQDPFQTVSVMWDTTFRPAGKGKGSPVVHQRQATPACLPVAHAH